MRIPQSVALSLALLLPACKDDGPQPIDSELGSDSDSPEESQIHDTPPHSGLEDIDGDGYSGADDCDESNNAVNVGATEVCDGRDNNCDGKVDADATDAGSWYPDDDSDDYGDDAGVTVACDRPSSRYVSQGGDCDDDEPQVYPGATETWYDGVDSDCAGDDDYDADADGDRASAYEGSDCDDSDPTIYGGAGCRPSVSCSAPDDPQLASLDPNGVSDLSFAADCTALVSTILSGPDYVTSISSSGVTATYTGVEDYDIGSLAIDPTTGLIVVGYASTQGIGVQSGSSFPILSSSGAGNLTYNAGPWANPYMDSSPSSIAVDSSGCVWTPNWGSVGTLACVSTSGTVTSYALSLQYLNSVALSSAEDLYIALDDTLYLLDLSSLTLSVWVDLDETILDFTFDFNDVAYVETSDNLLRVSADGGTVEVVDAVTGDARLAISPDGYLYRMVGDPVSAATYQRYTLPDY